MVPKISEIFNKIISLNVFSVSHCLYWLLCCVYNSKVAIIITLEVISFLFVQTLKALNWNYSLKYRGLIKRTFLDLYRLLLKIPGSFVSPKHRTKSPPMEGPHTNVGTWAPSYLATLLCTSMRTHLFIHSFCPFL